MRGGLLGQFSDNDWLSVFLFFEDDRFMHLEYNFMKTELEGMLWQIYRSKE